MNPALPKEELISRFVMDGKIEDLQRIVTDPEDYNLPNGIGNPPLVGAYLTGNLEMLEFLLSNNADPLVKSGSNNWPVYKRCLSSTEVAVEKKLNMTYLMAQYNPEIASAVLKFINDSTLLKGQIEADESAMEWKGKINQIKNDFLASEVKRATREVSDAKESKVEVEAKPSTIMETLATLRNSANDLGATFSDMVFNRGKNNSDAKPVATPRGGKFKDD